MELLIIGVVAFALLIAGNGAKIPGGTLHPLVSGVYWIGDSLSASAISPGVVAINTLKADARRDGLDIIFGVNAKVGRSAISFLSEHGSNGFAGVKAALDAMTVKPNAAVVFLGTNDIGWGTVGDRAAFQKIKDLFDANHVSVVAIGPPVFDAARLKGANREKVIETMKGIFPNFLDTTAISSDLTGARYRTKDGVHFTKEGAALYGARMARMIETSGL
jgi:hypothetical protein